MIYPWYIAALAAVAMAATPTASSAEQTPSAQQPQQLRFAQAGPKSKQAPTFDQRYDIEELTPGQIQRAQEPNRPGGTTTAPKTAVPKTSTPSPTSSPTQSQRAIACSGAFAKNSSHLGLATVYKSENITFTEVDAPEGKKVKASVLFPKDPKRRLEVWWENEGSRSGTHLIVIGGQSTWVAPKGLKLGLPLAAIEKLNGKPFKIKGFDKDNVALISDWQNGALAELPGGCRVGVYLQPDAKAPAEARTGVTDDMEFMSTDTIFRTVKPTLSEILIGY
jgi:hypothetical protein